MSYDQCVIKSDFKKIRAVYSTLSDHDIFPIWVLIVLHFDGDFSTSNIQNAYKKSVALVRTGVPGDKKLDAWHFDDSSQIPRLYIYQTVYFKDPNKKPDLDKANEIAQAANHLFSDIKSINSEPLPRRGAIQALKKVMDNNGKLILRCFCNSYWNSGYEAKVKQHLRDDLRNISTIELRDLDQIPIIISERIGDLSGIEVDLSFYTDTTDPILDLPSMDAPGLGKAHVILASSKSLQKMAEDHSVKLFDKNVRLFLGHKGVNKSIFTTLKTSEGRNGFWYGHNGLTILADKVEKKADIKLILTNPQIINGCQTVSTFQYFADQEEDEWGKAKDFAIMVKVIELDGDAKERSIASERIAFASNNQAAIKPSDLRANDMQQKIIQDKLEKYGNGWFYQRKRGEWNEKKKMKEWSDKYKDSQGYRTIDREDYQQALRAYTGKPAEAITKKADIWDITDIWGSKSNPNRDLYQFVFSDKRKATDIILVSVLWDWFDQIFKVDKSGASYCKEILPGIKKRTLDIKKARALVVSHSIGLWGNAVKKAYGDYFSYPDLQSENIIETLPRGKHVTKHFSKNKWSFLEEYFTLTMRTWVQFIEEVKKRDTDLFNELKKPQSFDRLKQIFHAQIRTGYKSIVTPRLTQ
jgi:hypothetical protein